MTDTYDDGDKAMTKSELIDTLAQKLNHLTYKDVEFSVKTILEQMAQTLATGGRIEIRGFGSFSFLCITAHPVWAETRRRVNQCLLRVNMFPISSQAKNYVTA